MPEDRSLFNRLRALFLRYASHHEAWACGVGLPRHRLCRVGNIESVCRVGEGLRLSGWASVEVLRFSWPDGSRDVRPDLTRHDLRRPRASLSRGMGFEVTLPPQAKSIRVAALMPSGHVRHVGLQHPADPWSPRTRRRLLRAFVRDMIRALPAFAAYALRRGEAQKQAIKAALGLMNGPVAPLLDALWFGEEDASIALPAVRDRRFTIVMPVHNGFDMLREALDRVRRHTSGDWRIVIVDDASTDPRVGPFLRDWTRAQEDRAQLVTLERNGGFVVAANHGLAMAEGQCGPVILLNSDAFVPKGWAERLLSPLSDPSVASVTPFSNTAEIFSAPLAGHSVPMTGDMADRLDDVARSLCVPGTLPSAPTGVGFCMAMARDWLDRVPRLDPAFGRGYGEEVDWCQRVRIMGGRHVGMPGLFVLHAGGESFGAEKSARMTAANAMISARYPRYDADVQDYLRHDPLRTARLTLGIAWAGFGAGGPLPVYLAHSLGGGADMALEREIARDLEGRGAALVLRVGGVSRFVLELRLPGGRIDGATGSFEVVRSMLAAVPRLRIVYSCGVGDPVAFELPRLLLKLRRDVLSDRLEARLHDYFPVSPSYCLLCSDGRYRGPVSGDSPDPVHLYQRRDGDAVSLRQWQSDWRRYLSACDEITAYCRSSADILCAAYPALSHRISVRAPLPAACPTPFAPPKTSRVLGVLGNLNAQKGARIIADLARRLDAAGDPRPIVVIGNVDAACPLPARVRIHGGYSQDSIADLARHYGISTWIVPAIWPETYSFSTREALATGLPVIAFDIGGQGEAVRQAANGHAVPYDPAADLAGRLRAALPVTEPAAPRGLRPRSTAMAGGAT